MGGIVKAYVDGSYDKSTKLGGFGIVYLDEDDNIVDFDGGIIENKPILSMWNVAGEITAATTVLNKCRCEKIPSITIVYDYEGIGSWALGKWKGKNEFTKEYIETAKLVMYDVNVKFEHVKGHSGNVYNDIVDVIAKMSARVRLKPNEIKLLDDYNIKI